MKMLNAFEEEKDHSFSLKGKTISKNRVKKSTKNLNLVTTATVISD